MEYNSFYGGRRGASFVIVKKYRTILPPAEDNEGFNKVIRIDMGLAADAEISAETRQQWLLENCMVTCFQLGGDYLVANYDEYVIIDAYNKNDIDNGKVFRRGYDYTNDMGGAIYIGQIVGPAGMAPHTELKEYDAIVDMATEDGLYYYIDENGNKVETDKIPTDGTTILDGELNQYRKTQATLDTATEDLLPGHYFDEEGNDAFNDTIEYIACSIKDFESHESTVHIGFKVPYHVVRYTAETVSPYYHRSDLEPEDLTGDEKWTEWSESSEDGTTKFNNLELIKRTDDLSHPFFSQWDISIPKGIKGDTLKNFRITTAAEVDATDIQFDAEANAPEDYRITSDTHKKQILVYDYYNYDRDLSGDPVSIYLGDYNMIEDFRIDDDGTIVINYSHEHRDYYANYLKAVDTIQINPETGLLQIDYNYDQQYERDENGDFVLDAGGNKIPVPDTTTHYETYLQYIKDITLDDNGTMVFYYSYKDDTELKTETFENRIKWINKVEISSTQGAEDEGHLIVTYNTKRGDTGTTNDEGLDTFETDLAWVNGISLAENGLITLHYSGGGQDVDVNTDNKIKWITAMSIDPDTALWTVEFNNGDAPFTQYLQWVKDLSIAADGSVTWTYARETDQVVTVNNLIKWIDDATFDNETGVLTFIYNTKADGTNNDTWSTTLDYVKSVSMDDDGTVHFIYTDSGDLPLEKKVKWITSTTVNTEGTITINYNTGEIDTIEKAIQWIKNISLTEQGTFTVEYNNGAPSYVTEIITPKNIQVNTGTTEGEGTQKLVITYNNGTTEEIGNPLNYIMRTAVSNDFHLLVLHSDPAKRAEIVAAGENYSYDGRDDWQDMGAIKDYDGMLIGLNISVNDNPNVVTKDGAIAYLNTTYPNGLTENGLIGKIATVGYDNEDKMFYAYDYSANTWYYLGGVQYDVVTSVAGREDDENTQILAERMSANGIWFVVE